MAPYRIALLGGDGIGPEVIAAAVEVLDAAAQRFGIGVRRRSAVVGMRDVA